MYLNEINLINMSSTTENYFHLQWDRLVIAEEAKKAAFHITSFDTCVLYVSDNVFKRCDSYEQHRFLVFSLRSNRSIYSNHFWKWILWIYKQEVQTAGIMLHLQSLQKRCVHLLATRKFALPRQDLFKQFKVYVSQLNTLLTTVNNIFF